MSGILCPRHELVYCDTQRHRWAYPGRFWEAIPACNARSRSNTTRFRKQKSRKPKTFPVASIICSRKETELVVPLLSASGVRQSFPPLSSSTRTKFFRESAPILSARLVDQPLSGQLRFIPSGKRITKKKKTRKEKETKERKRTVLVQRCLVARARLPTAGPKAKVVIFTGLL